MSVIAKSRRSAPLSCPYCGYDVSRSIADGYERCPECGGDISPDALERLTAEMNAPPARVAPFYPFLLLAGTIGLLVRSAAQLTPAGSWVQSSVR